MARPVNGVPARRTPEEAVALLVSLRPAGEMPPRPAIGMRGPEDIDPCGNGPLNENGEAA